MAPKKPFTLTPRMQQIRAIFKAAQTVQECAALQPAGYMEWHSKSEELYKAGVRQSRCEKCCRWRYPHERCDRFETSSIEPSGD